MKKIFILLFYLSISTLVYSFEISGQLKYPIIIKIEDETLDVLSSPLFTHLEMSLQQSIYNNFFFLFDLSTNIGLNSICPGLGIDLFNSNQEDLVLGLYSCFLIVPSGFLDISPSGGDPLYYPYFKAKISYSYFFDESYKHVIFSEIIYPGMLEPLIADLGLIFTIGLGIGHRF